MLSIVIEIDSVRFDLDGRATGIVFWDAGGVRFPESNWNDSLLVVFEWWLDATLRLLRNETNAEELRFMDGPFWVSLEATGDELRTRFVDGRFGEDVKADFLTKEYELAWAVLSSAQRFCHYCRSATSANVHTKKLQRSCEHVASILKEQGLDAKQ